MKLEWFGDSVADRLAREADRKCAAAAHEAARIVRDEISIDGNGVPSQPGDYPHKQSGELAAGISAEKIGNDWCVVSAAPHAAAVEESRPYLRRGIEENIAAISDAIRRA